MFLFFDFFPSVSSVCLLNNGGWLRLHGAVWECVCRCSDNGPSLADTLMTSLCFSPLPVSLSLYVLLLEIISSLAPSPKITSIITNSLLSLFSFFCHHYPHFSLSRMSVFSSIFLVGEAAAACYRCGDNGVIVSSLEEHLHSFEPPKHHALSHSIFLV